MWNIGSVLCDIIIAVCMTYYVGFLTLTSPVSEEKFFVHNGSFHDVILPSNRPK
jgi:hypothetical protein